MFCHNKPLFHARSKRAWSIGSSYSHAQELSTGPCEKKGFDEDLVHAVLLQICQILPARSHVQDKQQVRAKQ